MSLGACGHHSVGIDDALIDQGRQPGRNLPWKVSDLGEIFIFNPDGLPIVAVVRFALEMDLLACRGDRSAILHPRQIDLDFAEQYVVLTNFFAHGICS